MMEKTKAAIIKTIILAANDLPVNVYLFGSFIYSDKYSDIDILIVANDIEKHEISRSRKKFAVNLKRMKINFHLTTLSRRESMQSQFINSEKCVKIK